MKHQDVKLSDLKELYLPDHVIDLSDADLKSKSSEYLTLSKTHKNKSDQMAAFKMYSAIEAYFREKASA